MNDGDASIDILDQNGLIISSKLRKQVVKGLDIYHAVYAVLVTPDNSIALSKIAQRSDLPNLHAGRYGCTAATIRRSNETSAQAMQRALKNELGLRVDPELLNEDMRDIDGTKRMIGLYVIRSNVPDNFNKLDIQEITIFSKEEFAEKLTNEGQQFTPLIKLFWQQYNI